MVSIKGKISKHVYVCPETLKMTTTKNSDHYHFDSIMEAQTYVLLRDFFPDKKIFRQYKILLLDGNDHFKPIYWLCDFCVFTDNNGPILIETKGAWLAKNRVAQNEFLIKLRLLDDRTNILKLKRLFLTGKNKFKIKNFEVINFKELANELIKFCGGPK